MKKVFYIAVVIVVCASCNKMLGDINSDPNQFTKVSPESILHGVFKRTADMASYNIFREVGHWYYVPRTGGRYDVTDGTSGNLWQNMYVNVLNNVQQVINLYGNDTAFANRLQIARIWQSYVYSILVGIYGPIPVTQANNPDYLTAIKYDPEDSVYAHILATLKDAVTRIEVTKDKLTYDAIYGGDLMKWKKFANTLRLRIALRCQRNLGAVATTAISEVMSDEANTISAEAETARMPYENINNNEHPFWRSEIKVNPVDPPKMSDYLLVFFRSYSDPRLKVWYDTIPKANKPLVSDTLTSTLDDSLRVVTYPVPYFGIPKAPTPPNLWTLPNPPPVGVPNGLPNASYSNVAAGIFGSNSGSGAQAARPAVIMGYSEACFLKAEARELGLGGSKTADQYYYDGINANMAYWNVPAAQRDAYKLVPGIAWGTAGAGFNNYLGIVNVSIPATNLEKIWTQEWLSFWPDQNFEFWCLQRRTQVLKLPPHTNPTLSVSAPYVDVPLRGSYPTNAVNLNPTGYNDALTQLNSPSFTDEQYNPYIPLKFVKPYTPVNWPAVPAFYDLSYVRKWYGTTIQDLQAAAVASGFTFTILSTFKP